MHLSRMLQTPCSHMESVPAWQHMMALHPIGRAMAGVSNLLYCHWKPLIFHNLLQQEHWDLIYKARNNQNEKKAILG